MESRNGIPAAEWPAIDDHKAYLERMGFASADAEAYAVKEARIRNEQQRLLSRLESQLHFLSGDSEAVAYVLSERGITSFAVGDFPKLRRRIRSEIRKYGRVFENGGEKAFRELDEKVNGPDGTLWDLIKRRESARKAPGDGGLFARS